MQQREHGRQWLELAGKTVVITGAAGGIGTALAAAFHDAGARLALLDRDVEKCAKLAAALDQPSALTVACDVADAASVTGAADLVQREMGGADILVNNAAILASGDFMELDVAEWRRLLAVNLDGCFLCAQAFGRHMRVRGGGAIVHVGSVSGTFPQPASGAYSIAKAGVAMLSKLIAVEWGQWGIRSNVVSPAMVLTPMSAGFYTDQDLRALRESMVPLGRIGMPEDVAEAILWLASPRAAYITGVEVPVDGALPHNLLRFIPRPGYESGQSLL